LDLRVIMRIHLIVLLLLISILSLSGCGGGTTVSKVVPPVSITTKIDALDAAQLAEDYTQSGKFLDAALMYSRLAAAELEPLKQHYQLLASESLLRGRYLVQASQLLDEVNTDGLEDSFLIRKTLLMAKIALEQNQPDVTLGLLEPLMNISTTVELATQILATRADAYANAGNILESAKQRIQLESLITEEAQRRENQLSILTSLSKLPDNALQQLITAPPPDELSGWLTLSRIAKEYQKRPSELGEQIKKWRLNFPQHSALNDVVEKMQFREEVQIFAPQKIALLLPSKNRFSKAATAIKNGFLSAYYVQTDDLSRPDLQFYDSGNDSESFWTAYNSAIADGAEFIVGPLDKMSVNLLSEADNLDVPTLALNYSDTVSGEIPDNTPKNLYQFGLSPEDEAEQVAERAWLNGYSSAIILVPLGKWGDRVHSAFKNRWEQLGGRIGEYQTYNPQKNDFSKSIRKVLNIDESERRHSLLHATINHKTFFTPRRRQDVDFVFIGAFPRQARQIRPQLKFHHAADLPVYATSHIFTGKINAQMDRDMNGVFFGDMPWVIPGESLHAGLKKEINKQWPDASEKYARLYALGIDAYNMIPSLNRLIAYRSEFYRGETGNLYLDDNNRIHRRLLWLGFKRGIPEILDRLN